MRLFFNSLVVLSITLSFAGTLKADAPTRTVATAGEATVYVVPDEVVVNLGVKTANENLDKVKQQNEEQSAKLVKAIKALGVEEKYIQTDVLNVSIEYTNSVWWQGIRGYVAQRSYAITLKDAKLFEKLVDISLKSGANEIGGVEFRTTELRKYRDQARSMAIKAAKEKAIALAKDLECGVGKPWQISESPAGYWGGFNRFSNASQNAMQFAGGGGESETLPLGQIAIRASVNVVFDLTDK
jgi:uncharacterized protein YggE